MLENIILVEILIGILGGLFGLIYCHTECTYPHKIIIDAMKKCNIFGKILASILILLSLVGILLIYVSIFLAWLVCLIIDLCLKK